MYMNTYTIMQLEWKNVSGFCDIYQLIERYLLRVLRPTPAVFESFSRRSPTFSCPSADTLHFARIIFVKCSVCGKKGEEVGVGVDGLRKNETPGIEITQP